MKPRILLLMLEFPKWEIARPWGYPAHLAIEEGLRMNDVETVLVPTLAGVPPSSSSSWLWHVRSWFKGQSFDQVWVWLVHTIMDEEALEWIQTLAPIRVGLIPESLDHTKEELDVYPHLQERKTKVFSQLKYFTHALACDEKDVLEINLGKETKAAWWTNMVPARFLVEGPIRPIFSQAAFYGSLYSRERVAWVSHPSLQGVMANPQSTEFGSEWPSKFDVLHEANLSLLTSGQTMAIEDLRHYVSDIKYVRNQTFQLWLDALKQWSATVQLPTIVKCYSSRVVESMCVGTPCISWKVPNRPRNQALFQENKEMLFFDPSSPDSLLAQIERIQRDQEFRRYISRNALETVRRFHTAEVRVKQILNWIKTGQEFSYYEQDDQADNTIIGRDEKKIGEVSLVGSGDNNQTRKMPIESKEQIPSLAYEAPRSVDSQVADSTASTTVFILTIGDITFPECLRAIQQQTAEQFVLDIIQNIHPMSAAFQEMIRRCETEYFIQVDEDMILEPTAVRDMELVMRRAPENVGMICFHLFDIERDVKIQGVKIYRTAAMKSLMFRDVKACEMDLLEQMGKQGIRWILHPQTMGRHGTMYTAESIYRRYKTLYEKDILEWNLLPPDIIHKGKKYRETGDPLHLFALLGAVDGIVSAPCASDQEKDFTKYTLKAFEVFHRLFSESFQGNAEYEVGGIPKRGSPNPPLALDDVEWKKDVPSLMETADQNGSTQGQQELHQQDLSHSSKKILLVSYWFWPLVGGVETIVAHLGSEFVKLGYDVDVATLAMPERERSEYNGMRIVSLDAQQTVGPQGIPLYPVQLNELVTSGRYAVCLVFSDPNNYLLVGCLVRDLPTETKLFVQLLVNKEGYEEWGKDPVFRLQIAELLQRGTGTLTLTREGIAPKFLEEASLPSIYLPNAVTTVSPSFDFREQYEIPQEDFLIIHVGNIWRVKNQLNLLTHIDVVPSGWKMVFIGHPPSHHNPGEEEYGLQFMNALGHRPEILFIPGLPPDGIAAAMKAADVVVLSSLAEISPLVILEAMGYGRAWLATPECGAVWEQAGGIIAPLNKFFNVLKVLQAHPDLRNRLGKAGYAHWSECYQWSSVMKGWVDLIEKGAVQQNFEMPWSVREEMWQLKEDIETVLQFSIGIGGGDMGMRDEKKNTRKQHGAPIFPGMEYSDRSHVGGNDSMDNNNCEKPVVLPQEHSMLNQTTLQEEVVGFQQEDQKTKRVVEDEFYTNLFIRSGTWSTPGPNTEETQRWEKIKSFLDEVSVVLQGKSLGPLRILDVGCGRGWLTNLLSAYGTCEGIEPVEPVIEYARTLFPQLTFHVGFPDTLLTRDNFQPYDLIVTSEVIEHISHAQKTNFIYTLKQLLKPHGAVILTTPRREVWEQWRNVSTPNQPIEDWITEPDLLELFQEKGFHELGRERIYFDLQRFAYVPTPSKEETLSSIIALYQVWAFGTGVLYQDLYDSTRGRHDGASSGQPLAGEQTHIPVHVHITGCVVSHNLEDSSQSQNPLVSVLVPTMNRRTTLKVALESIVQQTFTDYEIIVINDAGVDVEDIVTSLNTRNNVTSIRHGKNRGLAAARNSGLGVARGKYIAYLDDDDRFLPRHLEILVAVLEKGSCQVAYSDAWRVLQIKENDYYVEKNRDVPYSQDFNPDMLLLSNYFPVLCMMHEKACLNKTGMFDETLTTHEDWDLWIRLSCHYAFAHVKEITAEFTWRTDGSSMTSRIFEDFLRTKRLIYEKYDELFRLHPHLIPRRDTELCNLENRVKNHNYECSIIIPVCNNVELTKQCLEHLVDMTKGISYEVVIVDNHSTDGTEELLASLGGDVQIIRNTTNLGFAKACNQGARAARGKHLVFLNNDTIPKSGWLDPLIQEVDSHNDVAVVGSKLLYPNGTIQHAGVVISKNALVPYHLFQGGAESLSVANRRKAFQAVTAACMLVRKEIFEEIGGFDEGFVNGFEDIDLCLKIREMGKKVIYQPKSCLYHLESQTAGRKTHDRANAKRFFACWEHYWLVDEDLEAYQNGYIIQQSVVAGEFQAQLIPIHKVANFAAWQRVAALQQLLLGRKCQPLAHMNDSHKIRELLVDVEGWPSALEILEWVGRVCVTLECEQEAGKFWEKLLTIRDHSGARVGLASLSLKNGNLDEAQKHLDVLKRDFNPGEEGLTLQGILFMQRQNYSEAQLTFEQSLDIDAANRKARMGLGMACMGLGETEAAWDIFEQVVFGDPDAIDAIHCLLQAGTALQRWESLASHLAQFVERNPADCDMRFALSGVQFRAGYSEKAQEHLTWLQLMKPEFEGLEDLEGLLQTTQSQEALASIHSSSGNFAGG